MYAVEVRDRIMIAHSLPDPFFGPAQQMHGRKDTAGPTADNRERPQRTAPARRVESMASLSARNHWKNVLRDG